MKKDGMTDKERFDALLNYRKPDRVPNGSQTMSIGFNTKNLGFSIADAYDDPEKSFNSFLKTSEQYGWDQILLYGGHAVLGALDFGGNVRLPKAEHEGALVVISNPIQCEEDVWSLKMPDPRTTGFIPKSMRFAELQEEHGLSPSFFSRSPFTMAANMCGFERFLRWTMKKPEIAKELMRVALEHTLNVIQYWAQRFPKDTILIWMSTPGESNQLISPKLFEKFALPSHLEFHQRLKSLGIKQFAIHICGEQNDNLPYLSDASPWVHPSVLSFGREIDIDTAAKHFPEDIILGNIDPTDILMGPPDNIYKKCKAAIIKGKQAPGGFILGVGCDISPFTPPEHLHVMTRAIEDFGWYD